MDSTALAPAAVAVRVMAVAVIAAALPLALVAASVRSVTLDPGFYREEFAKHRIGEATGFSDTELARFADAFIAYFQSAPGRMDVRVGPDERPLFNERELRHMEDVQALAHAVFRAGAIALVALLLAALALVASEGLAGLAAIFRGLALGGALTVALLGLLAFASLLDFSGLFLRFHYLSFANDLWMLDPRRDRLIQLFPQGFFFDYALRVGLQAMGLGAAIGLGAWGGLRLLR